MQQMVESRSVSWSIVLHATVLLIAAFGLPALLPKNPDPIPLVMSVELLPISEMSNVKPSDQPIQKAQNAPAPKPAPTPPAPKAAPTPPTPAPSPPPPKTFDPDENAPPQDKIKPVEKKEPPKPEKTDQQKSTEDFNKILADMKLKAEKEQPKPAPAATPGTDKQTVAENKTKSDAPYNDAMPLSISEKDAIRSQFIPCWNNAALAGSKDAHTLAARIKVKLQPDGTVLEATLAPDQQSRYNSDLFFRAAADSAIRAVHKCSPLKNLPADKYNGWKDMEINFDPSDL